MDELKASTTSDVNLMSKTDVGFYRNMLDNSS